VGGVSEPVSPPAHLEPYVDILGPEEAERCFLTMGGKEIYLTERAAGRSELARLFGDARQCRMARTTAI
jgi:hypothetical protein